MAITPNNISLKNFVVDGSDRSVQDILSKLSFISKIKEHEKVDVHSLTIWEDCAYTSAYRTLIARGESREATLEWVKQVIGEAFEFIDFYLSQDKAFYKNIGVMLLDSLKKCNSGILNLKKTYNHDRMFMSKVEAWINIVDTRIDSIRS